MINDVIFCPRFLMMDLKLSDTDTEIVITNAVATFLARYGA
ncbi:MAG: TetR/AcrR family transcriptional regulator C-terminal domain-containing protein [Oscillatoriales cyanobacterium C42_A2020_001]|nr:TetR/AcrR family transcriptional regulator C-terminal domain-containing protein [Leptolyngbyaceae cyanobacterium C42_A2020_001]